MIREMTEKTAIAVADWQYEGVYAFYNLGAAEEDLLERLDGTWYEVGDAEGDVVGFLCYGASARIPAGEPFGLYRADALDIGLGMAPAHCGRGKGLAFVEEGLAFARERFGARAFRLSVATWNLRAIRVYEAVGFRCLGSFKTCSDTQETEFMVMLLA